MKNLFTLLFVMLGLPVFPQTRPNYWTTNDARTTTGTNDNRYTLYSDYTRIPSFPVAVFKPVLTNVSMVVDLMPSGDNSITNPGTSFLTAIDLANRDLTKAVDNTNYYVVRIALTTNIAIIGGSAGGTLDAPQVVFQAGTNNNRPFSWVYQGTGGASMTTNAWLDSNGVLWVLSGRQGTTNGSAPITGTIGEYLAVTNNFATGTNLTTSLDTNALKLVLTPGDWSVVGHATFASGTATAKGTQIKASIGLTKDTVNSDGTQVYNWPAVTNNAFTASISLPSPVRINTPTNVTVYMNANAIFTAGTWVVYGEMEATRIR